jgi:hypothetical protein
VRDVKRGWGGRRDDVALFEVGGGGQIVCGGV